jgi:hypothetical protein
MVNNFVKPPKMGPEEARAYWAYVARDFFKMGFELLALGGLLYVLGLWISMV